nr:ferritin [uncultured Arsenicibacter sp.]
MKDIVRLRTSIKEDIEQILNQQIQMEFESSSKYLAMASWCDRNGFEFSAGFFYKQSDEERQHGLKIFHYLCDQGVVAITPAVGAVQIEFDTLRSVFEAALEQEITVTNAINRIIATCRRENDYITEEFLRWYVKEQMEEEFIARRCLDLFNLIPADDTLRLDKELARVTFTGETVD